jgi:phenylalanyl-tRNA synthetase beta subunit
MKSKFDEKKCVSYAEINLTALENFKNSKKTDFSAHEAYETLQDQIITRDFSFVIDADQSFEKILETAKQTNHIEHVHVFDIYQ